MTTTCSTLNCGQPATSTVEGPVGRIAVCFTHECEAIDRRGWADVRARALDPHPMTTAQAVTILREQSGPWPADL